MNKSHDRHQMERDKGEKRLANKQLRERLDNIESSDEIYNRRCLNLFENLENMPATEYQRTAPPDFFWCLVPQLQSPPRRTAEKYSQELSWSAW